MESELKSISQEIRKIAFEWEVLLKDLPEDVIVARLNRQGRNIKQIIGHLIDSASNNHQRMVRLQYTSNLIFPDYTLENDMWICIQQHQQEDWYEMLQLWKFFNLHIAHCISHTDRSWLNNEWSDGNRDPVSLKDIIFDYLAHLTLHISEINSLIANHSQLIEKDA
ncbi:MAG: DinB family protein [Bacteroidales bacterium]|nr:DinB family protein [Bacteroidales bacterium]